MIFPIFLTVRTEFSDECYAVIGRALAFATSFELNCKAFEALMEMKKGLLFNKDENFKRTFCRNLEKKVLKQRINIIKNSLKNGAKALAEHADVTLEYDGIEYGTVKGRDASDLMQVLDEWLNHKLEDAREARNEIAHDLSKGIEHCAENSELRADRIKEVEALVRRIAEADVQVYNLYQALTNEPTYKGDYCEEAVRWVCEVEYR